MNKCKKCKWFVKEVGYGNENECFLNPPVIHQERNVENRGYNYHSIKPTVDEDDFCQFFEQKNK